jgi:hypothetical protein
LGLWLIRLLLAEVHDMTITTRGQTPDDFGDALTRIKADRTNRETNLL